MDKKANSPETPEAAGDQQTKTILFAILGIALAAPLLSMVFTIKAVNSGIESLKSPTTTVNADGTTEKSGPIMGFYEPLEFLVNLSDVPESHYLRTTISLAIPTEPGAKAGGEGGHGGHGGGKDSPVVQKLKSQEPIIRDTIIAVISSKQFKDLATVAGKAMLKESIRARLQEQLHLSDVAIYFTAFTLQ